VQFFLLFLFEIGKQLVGVLDRLWNKSGDEEDISSEEFEPSGDNDDYFDECESFDEFYCTFDFCSKNLSRRFKIS